MRFSSGDRIGRYEVRAPLGAGGMGEVDLARDPDLEREVALKIEVLIPTMLEWFDETLGPVTDR
ncbi:MAG: hypothetical protein ACRD2J_05730 [Thermoanaerobaculia bacterium]